MTASASEPRPQTRADPGRVEVDGLEDLDSVLGRHPGPTEAVVAEPVRWGDDWHADLRRLKVLRKATGRAVRLRWQMIGAPPTALRNCVHLVPPAAGLDRAAAESAARWRAAYAYGSFHYRVGPGFVTVKDTRPGGDQSRMIISGEDADRFLALARGEAPRSAELAAALAAMLEAGLALAAEDLVLVLPFRMRHWPVPFSAV